MRGVPVAVADRVVTVRAVREGKLALPHGHTRRTFTDSACSYRRRDQGEKEGGMGGEGFRPEFRGGFGRGRGAPAS